MRIIVLSKNRAAQAELLLRSIKEQVVGYEKLFITVFYNFDNEKYKQGYRLDIDFIAGNKPTDSHCGQRCFKLTKRQV